MCSSILLTVESVSEETVLEIPLHTTVLQTNKDSVLIKGSDPDWGGKFQLKDEKNSKAFITIDGISKDKHGHGSLFNLTIELKKFKEILVSSPKSEDDYDDDFDDYDEENLNDSVKQLYGIPIPVEFNGCMTVPEIGLDVLDEFLLYDIGFQSYFRSIFIPIGKKLKVGKIMTEEFFLFSDDMVGDEDSDGNEFPLELKKKISFDLDDDYDGDAEPRLLVKYKITKITSTEVYADIFGDIVTSPNSKMKFTFKIEGKGVWNRDNPLINEISINYAYTEKRKKSYMNITGLQITKSRLPGNK
ncbi:MAG: hypothetical protein H0W50_08255 [Parachlamydiaceae bacterium]|nr:hypothetical protein [Parachlamydiaceae bacterium]